LGVFFLEFNENFGLGEIKVYIKLSSVLDGEVVGEWFFKIKKPAPGIVELACIGSTQNGGSNLRKFR
jgi:hypothetical protein